MTIQSKTASRIFGNSLTTAQQKARQALMQLVADEGVNNAADVYTDVLALSRENTFASKHGLKPASGTVCLGRLFGKGYQQICDESDGMPHIPPGNDHASLWARGSQPVVYVFQPYKDALTPTVLARLTIFCQEYKLALTVLEDESFHYPGKTTLVMIQRRE